MKRLLQISCFYLSLGYLPFGFANELVFSDGLLPLEVNNKAISQSFFNKIDRLTLSKGNYLIKLQYQDLFESDDDDHQWVRSLPFWVSIVISDEGLYRLGYNPLHTVEQANAFAKNPELTLSHPNKQVTILNVSKIPLSFEKNKPMENKLSKSANLKNDSAAITTQPSSLEMLNFWWQHASDEQKLQFLQSVKK